MLIVVLILSQAVYARERLVMIGGGARPDVVMKRYVELAGGNKARVLIVPWASEEPQESYEALRRDLLAAGASEVFCAPEAPLDEFKKQQLLRQLDNATAVFFAGGDQRKIMKELDDALYDRFHECYKTGKVFGGTSAGTAIMSEQMITGDGQFDVIDGDSVQVSKGLGLLPGTIVDQHFIKRMRENRLFGLVLKYRDRLGLGIDEATALVVYDNKLAEVVGTSYVMVVDARFRKDALLVYLLKHGQRFDLRKRKLIN
ncbi:MAG: cyanophycinase [Acidobacteriota bacterium]|nr:cyanophycinase [Blastocatellia bacterium]MDW8412154.1 cyanophycinase [Acidobacteriota bacterium]